MTNRDLLNAFVGAYPAQPATAFWRAIEIGVLARRGLPAGLGLDLGCGDGILTDILLRQTGMRTLVGVDVDPLETQAAARFAFYQRVHTCPGDRIPEPDASFDFVLSNSVLEHIPDLEATIAEVARLLRKDGRFVFTVPGPGFHRNLAGSVLPFADRAAYLDTIDRRLAHHHYLSSAQWSAMCARNGLVLDGCRGYLDGRETRRWETLSRMTGGLLYSLLGEVRRPIEIQRRLGARDLQNKARLPAPMARALAGLLSVGVPVDANASTWIAPEIGLLLARGGASRVKLLTVSQYFESHRGGIEIVAGRLVREFARAGIDVTWLATDATLAPDFAAEPRLRAHSLAATNIAERHVGLPYPILAPRAYLGIAREVRKADVVLIHDALYLTSIAAYLAARWIGRPVVIVQHIGAVPFKNPILRWTMAIANRLVTRPILARSDQTVFISESTARQFDGLTYRMRPDVIFNGVDTEVFAPPSGDDEVAAARRHFGLPIGSPVALFVGRFVEKKGLPVLERLARARPDVMFAFAGWGPLDPRAWKLPNVRVYDSLAGPSLARLYRASNNLVLPSTGEGFPLVIQEALACGLPVICGAETASADPGAASFLTSVPINPKDPDRTAIALEHALAACLADTSGHDRSARAALAASRYSWLRAAARYGDLLARLQESRVAVGAASPLAGHAPPLQKRG